jgi:RNA polymerase sigma-70 factor (ECF subfamily)
MSVLDPESACELVRRIAAGEAEAEAELVERSGATLRWLARRFTRNEADAEDVYQETLMLALAKIRGGEVREPERLAGFLRSLAKNTAIQRYRRRSETKVEPAGELTEVPDSGRPDALSTVLRHERARLARVLLAELNVPRDRDVLCRYYIEEQDSDRICRELSLEGDHLYRILHRARQRFRRLWEEHHPAG